MPPNAKLISDIEALLAAAKSYDEEQPDPLVQLDLLERVEAVHYQLDDPDIKCKMRHLSLTGLISQSTYSSSQDNRLPYITAQPKIIDLDANTYNSTKNSCIFEYLRGNFFRNTYKTI